jgi:signal transduction histidine kinase
MEEVLSLNAYYIVLVGSITMLILVVGILFFFILYNKRLIQNIREKQDLKVEYQKQSLHSYIKAQESERKRIAADLHDGIGASLAAIKMMLNQLSLKKIENQDVIDECKSAIQQTSNSAREISHNLMPPSLETVGLIKSIERLAKSISGNQLQVRVQATDNLVFPKTKELPLYRIIQELVNNTLKHANAKEIDIKFVESSEKYIVKYADDGKGFKTNSMNGLGLRNIESRVEMIQGTLKQFSTPFESTGIVIELNKNE